MYCPCHIRRGGICLRRPFETIWTVWKENECARLHGKVLFYTDLRELFWFCVDLRSVFQNRQFWNGGSLYPRNGGCSNHAAQPASYSVAVRVNAVPPGPMSDKSVAACACWKDLLEHFFSFTHSASALRGNGFCTVSGWSLVCSSSLQPLDFESTCFRFTFRFLILSWVFSLLPPRDHLLAVRERRCLVRFY